MHDVQQGGIDCDIQIEMPSVRKISIVIPAYNESESLPHLMDAIFEAASSWKAQLHEIIVIDDGSSDQTWKTLNDLVERERRVPLRAYRFRRNFGKATALDLGFKLAEGDLVLTMDADLQDDPHEVNKLLQKLDEGYDLVTGWKQKRNDPIDKTLPSRVFNAVTSSVTGLALHDFNCGFKLYRPEVLSGLRLYGELHRFIPALAAAKGFRVAEVPVVHHSRKFGESKYGWRRFFKGFIDLLTVVTTTRFLSRPAHLFGGIGSLMGILGFCILLYLTVIWVMGGGPIGNRPLLFLGVLCVLMGAQLLSFGLLAELFLRRMGENDPRGLVSEKIDRVRSSGKPDVE
jgi:dolichol-phosphate mannosyltransferase